MVCEPVTEWLRFSSRKVLVTSSSSPSVAVVYLSLLISVGSVVGVLPRKTFADNSPFIIVKATFG